ncbi:MAG: hypothetical protein GTN39_00875 [Candidatus Aenigmarchaeota archaeon]|nr:hypothetical protein [Candidatus Aenigmarchaeota archaeon]
MSPYKEAEFFEVEEPLGEDVNKLNESIKKYGIQTEISERLRKLINKIIKKSKNIGNIKYFIVSEVGTPPNLKNAKKLEDLSTDIFGPKLTKFLKILEEKKNFKSTMEEYNSWIGSEKIIKGKVNKEYKGKGNIVIYKSEPGDSLLQYVCAFFGKKNFKEKMRLPQAFRGIRKVNSQAFSYIEKKIEELNYDNLEPEERDKKLLSYLESEIYQPQTTQKT